MKKNQKNSFIKFDNDNLGCLYNYSSVRDMFESIPGNEDETISTKRCKEIFDNLKIEIENVINSAVDEIEEMIHAELFDDSK